MVGRVRYRRSSAAVNSHLEMSVKRDVCCKISPYLEVLLLTIILSVVLEQSFRYREASAKGCLM